ncbi:hypothetical protein GGD63_002858 [Bradyrhizobium sp. cir1]|nr:hypothetical protein [Bradyrhizobium sp. cir1]
MSFQSLNFPPEVTTEGARSTIVRRQQEDHDGESEEEEKQEGQKGQEGCSGEEDREEGDEEEGSQEVREEICQEICEEGRPEEGCQEGSKEGGGQEGCTEEGRQEDCKESGTEEGEGSSRAEAVSAGGSPGSRACRRDKLGDAFVFCGTDAGRGAGLGLRPFSIPWNIRKQKGRGGDAAAFLHRRMGGGCCRFFEVG